MDKHEYKASRMESKDNNQKKNNSNMSIPRKLLLIFFIVCFLVSGFQIAKWLIETSKTENEYKDLATQVAIGDVNLEEGRVIGWIKIDNTTINYPIVRTDNNEYYLKRNFYKESSVSGAIFADCRNTKTLVDKNIVVYGHNMKNGSMFADLTDLYQGKLGKDITVNIYTEQKQLDFKVFSCYNTEPDEYSLNTSITESNYDKFITNLKNRSEQVFDTNPMNSNQVLTLSTCSNNGNNRIIVHAALQNVNI